MLGGEMIEAKGRFGNGAWISFGEAGHISSSLGESLRQIGGLGECELEAFPTRDRRSGDSLVGVDTEKPL